MSLRKGGGRGAYVRNKISQQDFVLKTHEGLMREGGIFAGHYGSNIPQTEKHDTQRVNAALFDR